MRFNKRKTNPRKNVNYEGDVAYKMTPEMELYSLVCTAGLQDKFYENANDTILRIKELVGVVKPEFVAKLAVYAREQMHLRSVPVILAVELAAIHKGDDLVSKLVERIVQRADEITEVLSYYQIANFRNVEKAKPEGSPVKIIPLKKKLGKLSHQIKLGLANSFKKFDEYQFAKYNQAGSIRLRDALFITHAKPSNKEQEALFKKIANNELKTPDTWEVKISACGKDAAKKKAAWDELVKNEQLGYMATMRNLRNMLEADISQFDKVASYLKNKTAVLNSRQLPFRFLSAYLQVKNMSSSKTSNILEALEAAVSISAENIQGFDDNVKVWIACDTSGSMSAAISERSVVQLHDIGLMLGMLLQSRCKQVVTGVFADDWKIKQLSRTNVLANVIDLRAEIGKVGYGTNGWKVLQDLCSRNVQFDKIMIFTDCQLWNNESGWDSSETGLFEKYWRKYKKAFPAAKLYLFDMAGYGNTPIDMVEKDVFLIAGWSDKIFDMLAAIEKGSSVIDEIKKIEI